MSEPLRRKKVEIMPRGDNPNSRKNLNVFNSETAREAGRKGQIKSTETKRRRKTLREELLTMLEDKEIQESITLALIKQAQEGNTKAYEIVRDTIGEKPTEKIAVSTLNEDSISKLQDAIKKRRKK